MERCGCPVGARPRPDGVGGSAPRSGRRRSPRRLARKISTHSRIVCSGASRSSRHRQGRADRPGGRDRHRSARITAPALPPPRDVLFRGLPEGVMHLAAIDGVHFALWPPDELRPRSVDGTAPSRQAEIPLRSRFSPSIHSYAGPEVERALERQRRVVLVRRPARRTWRTPAPSGDRPRDGALGTRRRREHGRCSFRTRRYCICVRSGRQGDGGRPFEQARRAGATMPLVQPQSLDRYGAPDGHRCGRVPRARLAPERPPLPAPKSPTNRLVVMLALPIESESG